MTTTRILQDRAKIRNRARFREEVTEGIRALLKDSGHRAAWLARRLKVSPPRISRVLEGSNNFEIDTLADLSLAFGRGVHIVFGVDEKEIRFAVDEAVEDQAQRGTATETTISDSFLIQDYQHLSRWWGGVGMLRQKATESVTQVSESPKAMSM